MICLDLPWPPAVNNLFATYNGRRIPSRRYKAWIADAKACVVEQGSPSLNGHFCVSIECSPPDRRRRDLDGLAKAPLDLLVTAGVIEDDSLARRIILAWSDAAPAKPGALRLTLRSAEPA